MSEIRMKIEIPFKIVRFRKNFGLLDANEQFVGAASFGDKEQVKRALEDFVQKQITKSFPAHVLRAVRDEE